jgi:hypothetical protein
VSDKLNEKACAIAAVVLTIIITEAVGISCSEAVEVIQSSQSGTLAGVTLPDRKAPVVISGDNVYVVWWTNDTANNNGEVMFRASNDSGATFGDKINLSNNTVTNSVDAEIAANDGNVIVTWWERNSTSNEPVMKVSNDNGGTFGPILKLATNGTIGAGE